MTAHQPDPYADGYTAALATLNRAPGPLVRTIATRLLDVASDPADDLGRDAGFRAGLREAIGQERNQ